MVPKKETCYTESVKERAASHKWAVPGAVNSYHAIWTLIGMEDKPDGDKDNDSLKPPQTETRHKERSRRHRSKPYLGAKED